MTTTDNDLFSPDPAKTNAAAASFEADKPYYEQLVGEGKKFADNEALAKAKAESDAFIENLKEEKRLAREDIDRLTNELKSRARLEEIADRLNQAKEKTASNDGAPNPNERVETKPAFDPKEVESLFDRKLLEAREKEKRDNNLKLVKEKLSEKFGSKYPDILRETTRNLGLSDDDAKLLAEKSPQALIDLVMPRSTKTEDGSPPRSAINSGSFKPSGGDKKTYAYYDKMRKEQPELYNSPRIQQERWKMAKELGPDFMDVS